MLIIIGVYESIKKQDFAIVLVRGGYCWWVVVVEWGADVKDTKMEHLIIIIIPIIIDIFMAIFIKLFLDFCY